MNVDKIFILLPPEFPWSKPVNPEGNIFRMDEPIFPTQFRYSDSDQK